MSTYSYGEKIEKNEYFSFVLKVNRKKVRYAHPRHKIFFRGLSLKVNRNGDIDIFRFLP